MKSPAVRKLVATALGAAAALAGLSAAEPAYDAAARGGDGSPAVLTAAAAPEGSRLSDPRDGPEHDGVARQAAAVGADENREVLDYWTPRRMAEATPLVPALNDVAETVLPGPGTDPQAAGAATGERWRGGGKVARTTGKVFLTLDGRDFTCSASVVPADNRDTVLTAGHCLKDGAGAWVDKWVFVPGFDDGESPYGRRSEEHTSELQSRGHLVCRL